MFCIPIGIGDRKYTVLVVLQADNIERIREYDPAVVTINSFGEPWNGMKLADVSITFATAEDEKEAFRLCREGMILEAVRFLTRGFRYRPDKGDKDGAYESALNPHHSTKEKPQ